MKILFVCHGNINRSVAAEIMLSSMSAAHQVRSSGLRERGIGVRVTKKARETLAGMGYGLSSKRAVLTRIEDVEWADVVYYFDSGNLRRLQERFPQHSSKFKCLGILIGETKINDPHFDGSHEFVFNQIERALVALMENEDE